MELWGLKWVIRWNTGPSVLGAIKRGLCKQSMHEYFMAVLNLCESLALNTKERKWMDLLKMKCRVKCEMNDSIKGSCDNKYSLFNRDWKGYTDMVQTNEEDEQRKAGKKNLCTTGGRCKVEGKNEEMVGWTEWGFGVLGPKPSGLKVCIRLNELEQCGIWVWGVMMSSGWTRTYQLTKVHHGVVCGAWHRKNVYKSGHCSFFSWYYSTEAGEAIRCWVEKKKNLFIHQCQNLSQQKHHFLCHT